MQNTDANDAPKSVNLITVDDSKDALEAPKTVQKEEEKKGVAVRVAAFCGMLTAYFVWMAMGYGILALFVVGILLPVFSLPYLLLFWFAAVLARRTAGHRIRILKWSSIPVACMFMAGLSIYRNNQKTAELAAIANAEREFKGHTELVWKVTYTPDSKSILTAGDVPRANGDVSSPKAKGRCVLIFWDIETGQEIRRFAGHSHWQIHSLAVSPDGVYALSTCEDKTNRLWNLSTGEEVRTLGGSSLYGRKGFFSSDSKRVFVGGETVVRGKIVGQGVFGWEIESDTELRPIPKFKFDDFAPSADGKRVIALSGYSLESWDLASGQRQKSAYLDGVKTPNESRVVVSGDSRWCAVVGHHDTIVWDMRSWKEAVRIPGQRPGVFGMGVDNAAFSNDGKLLILAKWSTLEIFDCDSWKPIRSMNPTHLGKVLSVAFAPDGESFVASGKTVLLWRNQMPLASSRK